MFPKSVRPYPQQVELARLLKEKCSEGQVLIFESPTGTGKTCSLLSGAIQWLDFKLQSNQLMDDDLPDWLKEQASAMASTGDFILAPSNPLPKRAKTDIKGFSDWLNQYPLSVPKIYYVSRTHSQLSQALNELRRFEYSNISATVQASRTHLCINDKVNHLKGDALNEKCHELVDQAKCPYFNPQTSTTIIESSLNTLKDVADIEDLVSLGKSTCVCPYYFNKAYSKKARFIFLPYPSMIIPQIRKGLGIYLKDALIIFDEAHNLPDAINSMNSYSVQLSDMQDLLEKIRLYLQKYNSRMNPKNSKNIQLTISQLEQFINFLKSAPKEFSTIDYFSESDLQSIDFLGLASFVEEYRLLLKCGVHDKVDFSALLSSLSKISSSGRFLLENGTLQYVSFDPSEAFEDILMETRALVFAGGTIGPLSDFAAQLLPSDTAVFTKSFGHLIKPQQLKILLLSTGPTGKPFRFTFENRNNTEMYNELTASLRNMEKIVPGGIAIFLPSYQTLETFKNLNSQFSRPFFFETSNSEANVFDAYKNDIDKGISAILASVIGGKLSEGINFSDNYARAVLIVGLPYPNIQQDRVTQLRVDFLSKKLKTTPSAVLESQCMRTVNQALGRAIRHINDYAVAILIDERYSQKRLNVPLWMQPSVDPDHSHTMINNVLSEFRWLFYVAIGLFLYGGCINYLKKKQINLFLTLEVKDHEEFAHNGGVLCSLLLIFLLLLQLLFHISLSYAQFIIPLVSLIIPIDIYKEERFALLKCLYRLIFPKGAIPIPMHQVVLADILTSYAKILADWDVLFFCSLIHRIQSNNQQCAPSIFGILLVCMPYVIRIRQCWHDLQLRKEGRVLTMLNMIKYLTSFPVVYLSYIWLFHPQNKGTWVAVNLVNYVFSSTWDVFMDWNLYSRLSMRQLPIILLSLLIRGLWMMRLVTSASIDNVTSLLEIMRRFMWLVLRIEALDQQQSSKSPLLGNN